VISFFLNIAEEDLVGAPSVRKNGVGMKMDGIVEVLLEHPGLDVEEAHGWEFWDYRETIEESSEE
jgi:hypothetical protein